MRIRRYCMIIVVLWTFAVVAISTSPASAQIHFEGVAVGGILPVCSFQGDLAVSSQECDSSTSPVRQPSQSIHIGPYDSSSVATGGLRVYNNTGDVQVIGDTTFEKGVTLNAGARANGAKIINLGTPTDPNDAANKAYVDQAVSGTQTQLAEHETRISDVESTTADHETRITTVETTTADHETRISAEEATSADHETRISTVESEVSIQGSQIASIQQDLTSINRDIAGLRNRDTELADGIAIALAMEQPQLLAGQTFAMRGGWGNFDGFNAFALSAAGLVSRNTFGTGSSVIVDGGIGTSTSQNMTAGRAGLTIGW